METLLLLIRQRWACESHRKSCPVLHLCAASSSCAVPQMRCGSLDGCVARSLAWGRHLDARTKPKTTHELPGRNTSCCKGQLPLATGCPELP